MVGNEGLEVQRCEGEPEVDGVGGSPAAVAVNPVGKFAGCHPVQCLRDGAQATTSFSGISFPRPLILPRKGNATASSGRSRDALGFYLLNTRFAGLRPGM